MTDKLYEKILSTGETLFDVIFFNEKLKIFLKNYFLKNKSKMTFIKKNHFTWLKRAKLYFILTIKMKKIILNPKSQYWRNLMLI